MDQDTGETSFTASSANLNGGGITFYRATTTTRHSFQTIFAMDTVIYIGVQKVP